MWFGRSGMGLEGNQDCFGVGVVCLIACLGVGVGRKSYFYKTVSITKPKI